MCPSTQKGDSVKKWISLMVVSLIVGCTGIEGQSVTLPGIGLDPDQSVNENVEYRLLFLGTHCQADLFSTVIIINQNETDLTAMAGDQVVATATMDASGQVTAVLHSPSPSSTDLECTGLYNEGVFDMTCPV